MLYEKEIAELWKEWKKSTEKYEEAIEDGYDVDAEMWANDVETIHRQIHLYEQAAKADEYETNLNEFKRQLKIKIRHARRDGDYSEASAFFEALDMIEYLI